MVLIFWWLLQKKTIISYLFFKTTQRWPTRYFPTEFIKYSTNLDGSINPVNFPFHW